MSSKELSKIIRKIKDLPTLPRTLLKITETINNPRSSANDLAGIIADDQVLTARLLKLVNSSFYGFPQRVSTVTNAIVLLGFDAIRNLLLTSSVFDLFSNNKIKKMSEMEEQWDHSFGCALGAKVIGNFLRYEKIEELFVAGLLHDIGKIVEMMFLRDDFSKVASMVKEQDILFITAEESLLGYTHTEVGKLLAEKWNLPVKLIDIIAHHHNPGLAGTFSQEAGIVHLSDILCRALNMGSGGDNKMPPLNREGWESLQLDLKSIEPIMEEMEREFEDIRLFMSGNPHIIMSDNQQALLALIEKMERLNRFQDKIDTSSNIDRIWDVFLAEFKNLIAVDVCALFLVDKDTHEFALNDVSPGDQGAACQREVDLQIDCGMFSWIINRRQPAFIPSLVFKEDKTILMLPLTTNRRTVGVVLGVTSIKESSITQENLKLVTLLLKQCSLMMENSLLYEHLNSDRESLQQANKEIAILSITDPLTGSYNRAYLSEQLPVEIKRSRRYKRHLSIILCDIDDFKQVNDRFGHQAGDAVLKEFVRRGRELIRKDMDWIVRYGGEEFLFVLPDTHIEGGSHMAERLRANLSKKIFEFNGKEMVIEASFGVTGFGPDTPDDKVRPDHMIGVADRSLYQAKNNGKNMVVSNSLLSG